MSEREREYEALIERLQTEFDRNEKYGQSPYSTVKQEDLGLAIAGLKAFREFLTSDNWIDEWMNRPDPRTAEERSADFDEMRRIAKEST